jgi:hypothetical protein
VFLGIDSSSSPLLPEEISIVDVIYQGRFEPFMTILGGKLLLTPVLHA